MRFNLRTLAVGTGLTYELLTGDYDQISYSNLRGIRLDLAQASSFGAGKPYPLAVPPRLPRLAESRACAAGAGPGLCHA